MDFGIKFEKSPVLDVRGHRSVAKHRRIISFDLADRYDPKQALKYQKYIPNIFETNFGGVGSQKSQSSKLSF